jgi:RHS repeat-associated protein
VDPEGRRTRFVRDGNGQIARVEQGIWPPSGQAWDLVCSASVTDGAAQKTEIVELLHRDSAGLVTYEEHGTSPSGSQVPWNHQYSYDGYRRLIQVQLSNGLSYRRGYDARNLVTWTATYKSGALPIPAGLINSIPDPADTQLGSLAQFSYDALARLNQTRRLWFLDRPGEAGRPPSRILLGTTGWKVNARHFLDSTNAIETVDSEGNTLRVEYDALNRITRAVFPGGVGTLTNIWADNSRRVTGTIAPASTDTGQLQYTFRYTDFGTLRSIDRGAPTTSGAATQLERRIYDALGRLKRVEGRAEKREFAFNGFGELTSVSRITSTGALEPYVSYQRNRNGVISGITDGLGNQTLLSFDHLNRLLRETYADGSVARFDYRNGTRAVQARWDRNGDPATYAYDAFEMVSSMTAFRGGFGKTGVQFMRDGLGIYRAMSSNNPNDPRSDVGIDFLRDSTGEVVEETSSLFPSETVSYVRDSRGNPLSVRVASTEIARTYDGFDRVLSVSLGSQPIAQYQYPGFGAATEITYGNNLRERRHFDNEGRRRLSQTWFGTQEQFGNELYWAADGTLARNDRWLGSRPASAISDLFRNDPFGRLQSAAIGLTGLGLMTSGSVTGTSLDSAINQGTRQEHFTLDAADNWRSAIVDGFAVTPDIRADNAYRDFNGQVSLDAAGNTESLPSGAAYGYDGLGRMVTATQSGGPSWTFRYDTFGRLAAWATPQGSGRLQYSDNQVLREAGSGSPLVYVPGSQLTPVAVVRDTGLWFNHDHWGSRVALATDGSGRVAELYEYSAYGAPRVTDAAGSSRRSSIGNQLFVAAQPYFPELGMHRFGVRWYLPTMGRFLSPDPIGYAGGSNLFAYSGDRPVEYVDPSGLDRQRAADGLRDVGGPDLWGAFSLDRTLLRARDELEHQERLERNAHLPQLTPTPGREGPFGPRYREIIVPPPEEWPLCTPAHTASDMCRPWRDLTAVERQEANTNAALNLSMLIQPIMAFELGPEIVAKDIIEDVPQVTRNRLAGNLRRDQLSWERGAPATERTYKTVFGERREDVVDIEFDESGVDHVTAMECKEGYTCLGRRGSRIRSELARDWWLLREGAVDSVEWHFFCNAAGEGGCSKPLRDMLDKLGFRYVPHF